MDLSEMKSLVDKYQQARKVRLDHEKVVKQLKTKEDTSKEEILAILRDSASPVIGGTTHQCTRTVINEPTVEDWDVFYGHIYEFQAWDLLHRRVSSAAVKMRWDENEEVPGVGAFPVEKLSLTKLPEGA